MASIDHIEVLRDGAAAQYGSDTISGVINIILKQTTGGSSDTTLGQGYDGKRGTGQEAINYGFEVGEGQLPAEPEPVRLGALDRSYSAKWITDLDVA